MLKTSTGVELAATKTSAAAVSELLTIYGKELNIKQSSNLG